MSRVRETEGETEKERVSETRDEEKEGARLHAFNCLLWASLQMSPAVPLHGGFQSVEHRLRPRPRPPFKCQSDRRGWGMVTEGWRQEKGGVWWKGSKGG